MDTKQPTAAEQLDARADVSEGGSRSLLSRLVMPADDWARQGDGHGTGVLLSIMSGCILALLVVGGLAVELWLGNADKGLVLGVLLALLGVVIAVLVLLMRQIHQFLLTPLAELYGWALRMCDGDFGARMSVHQSGHFAKLRFHINRLSEALDRLANEMDDVVSDQTQRLQAQNDYLDTLYQVTTALNAAGSLGDALDACSARLRQTLRAEEVSIVLADESRSASASPDNASDALVIPLAFNGEHLGQFCVAPASVAENDNDTRRLLDGVARHLAMAVARARLADEALNVSLMRERTLLAHELHDSLAQTLASLRMRVHILGESLSPDAREGVRPELDRIKEVLREANTEARELIAHFRAPVDNRGLKPALENLISRCKRDNAITYYLQASDPAFQIAAASELQVLRIVREALTNAEKHSHAGTVRVMVDNTRDGRCRVLVEDDGVGIPDNITATHPGEHIGLSIMQDRARLLGGTLSIDSEPDEGTRVLLEFDPAYEVALPGMATARNSEA